MRERARARALNRVFIPSAENSRDTRAAKTDASVIAVPFLPLKLNKNNLPDDRADRRLSDSNSRTLVILSRRVFAPVRSFPPCYKTYSSS